MLSSKNLNLKSKIRDTIPINWGTSQLEYLIRNKYVIIRAISYEWLLPIYTSSPSEGRRLWFEIVSFSNPVPTLNSPLIEPSRSLDYPQYTIDVYHFPSMWTYSDYTSLLDYISSELTDKGYKVLKHLACPEPIELGSAQAYVAKFKEVKYFSQDTKESHLLDDVPESVFLRATKDSMSSIESWETLLRSRFSKLEYARKFYQVEASTWKQLAERTYGTPDGT